MACKDLQVGDLVSDGVVGIEGVAVEQVVIVMGIVPEK